MLIALTKIQATKRLSQTLTAHKIIAKQNLTRGKNKKFMISLIYDCSGLNFSAGLYQNQQLIFSEKITEAHKHSEIMVATIDKMLQKNNLFYQDLESGKITQITNDGKKNSVINGLGDWVYERTVSKLVGEFKF